MSALLQSKGLQGKDLQQKLEETFARIPKQDLQGWAAKGTWQALKQTVGTRITFLSRQQKEHDPWEDSDPWSQALSSKDPKPKDKQLKTPPQIVLIPQVWENEDKTSPGVLERPTRGSSGLAIMSPQDFINTWAATSMPASPDELTVVVWPPLHEEVQSIPHEAVIFPARVLQQGSVTLLKGIAYHLGAKRISLKHEDANEFKNEKSSLFDGGVGKEPCGCHHMEPNYEQTDGPRPTDPGQTNPVTLLLGNEVLGWTRQDGLPQGLPTDYDKHPYCAGTFPNGPQNLRDKHLDFPQERTGGFSRLCADLDSRFPYGGQAATRCAGVHGRDY